MLVKVNVPLEADALTETLLLLYPLKEIVVPFIVFVLLVRDEVMMFSELHPSAVEKFVEKSVVLAHTSILIRLINISVSIFFIS
ncbi:MAG: hypothetical protein IJR32_05085 [Paludibacteraceae bacterium]|nr:hypothetical protein [Paludibacteraceae bacterium]